MRTAFVWNVDFYFVISLSLKWQLVLCGLVRILQKQSWSSYLGVDDVSRELSKVLVFCRNEMRKIALAGAKKLRSCTPITKKL